MANTYKKYTGLAGEIRGVILNPGTPTQTSFMIPVNGEDESAYLNSDFYKQYKQDLAAGIVPADPDAVILRYSEYQDIQPLRLITTDNVATQLVRYTLAPGTMYVAKLELEQINMTDAGIPVRHIEATITAKRIAGGALLVNTPAVTVDQPDVAGAIPVTTAVSGNDLIIRVTGITGKTMHWFLSGKIKVVTSAGK